MCPLLPLPCFCFWLPFQCANNSVNLRHFWHPLLLRGVYDVTGYHRWYVLHFDLCISTHLRTTTDTFRVNNCALCCRGIMARIPTWHSTSLHICKMIRDKWAHSLHFIWQVNARLAIPCHMRSHWFAIRNFSSQFRVKFWRFLIFNFYLVTIQGEAGRASA